MQVCYSLFSCFFGSPYFRFLILFSSSETKRKWTAQYRCAAHRQGCKACVTVTLLDEDESHDEEDEPPRELSGSENNAEPEDKNLKSIHPQRRKSHLPNEAAARCCGRRGGCSFFSVGNCESDLRKR